MKFYLIFIYLLIVGFMSTAQNATSKTIEEAIAIKPSLTLIDFSDKSLSMTATTPKFSALKYAQGLKNKPEGFHMDIPTTQTVRAGFTVFHPNNLKRSFFQDFNSSYRRSQLERLLPRLPDISDFTPCF